MTGVNDSRVGPEGWRSHEWARTLDSFRGREESVSKSKRTEKGAPPGPEEDEPGGAPLSRESAGLEGVAEVGKDVVDLPAEERHRDDGGNGDERQEECVLGQALSGLCPTIWQAACP